MVARKRWIAAALTAAIGSASAAITFEATVASAVPVCTHTRTGASGKWETANAWFPPTVPGAGAVACIPAGKTVVIDANSPGAEVTVDTVQGQGAIEVNKGAKLYLTGDPATRASSIGRLDLVGGTLGGSSDVTITSSMRFSTAVAPQGAAAMTTRRLVDIAPSPGGSTAAPPRAGRTIIGPGATLTISDDNATGCDPYNNNGVALRDGRVLINNGTMVIEPCAYVAADWGTSFRNNGTTRLEGSLGWFEGFLKSDLGWPTSGPQFTNASGAVLRLTTTTGDRTFVISGVFASAGGITIVPDAVLSTDNRPGTVVLAALSRAGSLGTGGCDSAVCTGPQVNLGDQEAYVMKNASRPLAPSSATRLQEAATRRDTQYGTVGAQPVFEVGRRLTAAANGAATSNDPYLVTILVDAKQVNGTPSLLKLGWIDNGTRKVAPACTAAVSTPCLSSVTPLPNGDAAITVKTTRNAFVIVPLGAKIYR